MEMNWSRWFRCESSFGMLLVPNQPGIFALAEEVMQPAEPNSRRMLAVFEVQEADDLARAMSRLFAVGSPWRAKLVESRCYVRYAVAPSIADRRAAASALKTWLNSQREVASQIFETNPGQQRPAMARAAAVGNDTERLDKADIPGEIRGERRSARAEHEGGALELKTVAERAVDRVTHGIKLSSKPAGF
jgi:acyl-CoA reductase-like NAD-dependent aldehyde dehydrogenase